MAQGKWQAGVEGEGQPSGAAAPAGGLAGARRIRPLAAAPRWNWAPWGRGEAASSSAMRARSGPWRARAGLGWAVRVGGVLMWVVAGEVQLSVAGGDNLLVASDAPAVLEVMDGRLG